MPNLELTADEAELIRSRRIGQEPKPRLPTLEDYADPDRPWGESPAPNPPTVQRLPDARTWVEKQQRGATTVGAQNYLDGVRAPRKDPIQAGIAAQPAYDAAMSNPNIRARRVSGLQRTNMAEWAAKAESIGASRYPDGVVASRPKLERGITEYRAFLEQHLATIDRMPAATAADRDRRVLENLHGLRTFKDSRR